MFGNLFSSFQDSLQRLIIVTGIALLLEVVSDVLKTFLPGYITQWIFMSVFFVSFFLLFFTFRQILKREIHKLEISYRITKYSSNISQGIKYIPAYIMLKSASLILVIFTKTPTEEQQNLMFVVSFLAPLVLLPSVLFIRKGFEDTEVKGMFLFIFYAIVSVMADPFPYLEPNMKGDPIKIRTLSYTIFFVQQAILCAIAVLILLKQPHKLANISQLGKEMYKRPQMKAEAPVFTASPQNLSTSVVLSKQDLETFNSAKKEILSNINSLSNIHDKIYMIVLLIFNLLLIRLNSQK